MIVNKPQFDTESIKPGDAYWLTKYSYNRRKEIDTPAIVRHVKPLTIVLTYYDEKQKQINESTIDINSVVNETFELKKMMVQNND